jgi:outer membrane receptor protein involved in Fe transport
VNHFNLPSPATCLTRSTPATPIQLTERAPFDAETHVHDGGIYAQDRWTIRRLTLNLGVRYDFYRTNYPTQTLGPTVYTPNRNVTFQATASPASTTSPEARCRVRPLREWPTALKASLAKYVEQLTYTGTYGDTANPANRTVQSVNRSWTDPNRNFLVECDLLNPLLNGECGQISSLAFGNPFPARPTIPTS